MRQLACICGPLARGRGGAASIHGRCHLPKDGGARRQHGLWAQRPGPRSVRRAFEQHHGGYGHPPLCASDVGGPTRSDDGRRTQVKVDESSNWLGRGFAAAVGSRPPSVRGAQFGTGAHRRMARRQDFQLVGMWGGCKAERPAQPHIPVAGAIRTALGAVQGACPPRTCLLNPICTC